MTKESGLWTTLHRACSPFGRMIRVENPADPGTPDVAYVLWYRGRTAQGWCELKRIDGWPKLAHTPIRLEHAERVRTQAIWQEQWESAGGRATTLLRIGPETFFFLPPWLLKRMAQGAVGRDELFAGAAMKTEGIQTGRWLEWLCREK